VPVSVGGAPLETWATPTAPQAAVIKAYCGAGRLDAGFIRSPIRSRGCLPAVRAKGDDRNVFVLASSQQIRNRARGISRQKNDVR
jgi:hypothetical protein